MSDHSQAKQDALRRSLGMAPKRKFSNKKHGSRHKKAQSGARRISRESRQVATS